MLLTLYLRREGGMNMTDIKDILLEMRELRKHLNDLIKENNDLLIPEIVETSQMLDSVLNKYGRIIKNKTDR